MNSTRDARGVGHNRTTTIVALLLAIALFGACSSGGDKNAKAKENGGDLVGLFRLTAGTAQGTRVTGTWFRMLQPGGNAEHGPYMINADSKADGGQATLLAPGTSGGLRTAGYQSQATPAFDANGASLSDAITKPTAFFGVKFSISTNHVDPQTKAEVPPPTITVAGGKLHADLSSWSASWNNQNFNQGAPKPVPNTGAKALGQEKAEKVWDWVAGKYLDGASKPTVTGADATGTYDAQTHAFTLEWTSPIQGGPFNGFTGLWHLQGVFAAGKRAPG